MEQIIAYAADYLKPPYSTYVFAFFFVPSTIGKFVGAKGMGKQWPTIPSWFWPVAGVWEGISAALVLHFNRSDIGVPMMIAHMGGVLACTTVLKFSPEIWPFMIAGFVSASVSGVHNGVPLAQQYFFPSTAFGFSVGVALHFLHGKRSNKKN